MFVCIGTVDNFITLPSPVLDESAQGYHLEQRLQVTLQAAANERQILVEFRLGEGSEAPPSSCSPPGSSWATWSRRSAPASPLDHFFRPRTRSIAARAKPSRWATRRRTWIRWSSSLARACRR